jgi:glc operon protein GlcG
MAVTLRQATECIERGLGQARELGFRVAIAVVDDAGHLVACHRMDGALWVTPEIARAKANASAAFQASTLDLEERFSKGRQLFASNVATLGDCAFVFGRGAVPIAVDGDVAGAVGVSGAVPADNDQTIAEAAAGPLKAARAPHP